MADIVSGLCVTPWLPLLAGCVFCVRYVHVLLVKQHFIIATCCISVSYQLGLKKQLSIEYIIQHRTPRCQHTIG
jgi:hypothetical protein